MLRSPVLSVFWLVEVLESTLFCSTLPVLSPSFWAWPDSRVELVLSFSSVPALQRNKGCSEKRWACRVRVSYMALL